MNKRLSALSALPLSEEGGLGDLSDFSRCVQSVWLLFVYFNTAAPTLFIKGLRWFLLGRFLLQEDAGVHGFHHTNPGSRFGETALYRTQVSPSSVSWLIVESTRV